MRSVVSFGEFRLDRSAGSLTRRGVAVAIRPKLWEALCLLIDRRGDLVRTEELRERLWGETAVNDRSIGNLIHELRKLLGDTGSQSSFIETVPARGIRWLAPVTEIHNDAAGGPLFVGRNNEFQQLRAAYTQAEAGERRLVVLAGNPGVGKTRTIERFLDSLPSADSGGPIVAVGRCIDREAGSEAYLPILDLLDAWREQLDEAPHAFESLFTEHAPLWKSQLWWTEGPDFANALTSLEARPERMQRQFAALTDAASLTRPLVLLIEDLHWADRPTVELVMYLAHRTTRARLLMIATYRPTDALATDHPVLRLQSIARNGHVFLNLQPLPETDVRSWLLERFDHSSPLVERLIGHIMTLTAGSPLFVHAVLQLLHDRGAVERTDAGWRISPEADLAALGVPEEIGDLLTRQMQDLPQDGRGVLEAAAVAGDEFDAAAIAESVGSDIESVDALLRKHSTGTPFLRTAGIGAWPDGTTSGRYRFEHALYRQALYDGIPGARRARLHREVGLALERGFAAVPNALAATLAAHFQSAGDAARAGDYLERTALQTIARSAIRDAVDFYRRALDQIGALPDDAERWAREIRVRTGYGITSALVDGLDSPVVPESYAAVSRLAPKVSDPAVLFPTLRAFWVMELMRFGYRSMEELSVRLREIGTASGTIAYRALAESMSGTTYCLLGELTRARTHLEASLALCDDPAELPQPHMWLADPRVELRCVLAWVLWLQGEATESRRVLAEGAALARACGHDGTRGLASWFQSSLAQLDSDVAATRGAADDLQALAGESDMPAWQQIATIVRALAALMEGDPSSLELGLHSLNVAEGSPSVVIARAYLLGQLALAYGRGGKATHGLALVDMALARIAENSARVSEADLLRIRGDLLEQTGDLLEADRTFVRAIEVATAQGARCFALRAAAARVRLASLPGSPLARHAPTAAAELREWIDTLQAFGETHDLHTARATLASLGG